MLVAEISEDILKFFKNGTVSCKRKGHWVDLTWYILLKFRQSANINVTWSDIWITFFPQNQLQLGCPHWAHDPTSPSKACWGKRPWTNPQGWNKNLCLLSIETSIYKEEKKREVPSRELTYPTLEKENHLQNAILGGYVSSLEGNHCDCSKPGGKFLRCQNIFLQRPLPRSS